MADRGVSLRYVNSVLYGGQTHGMTELFGGIDKATARPDGLPLGRGTCGAVPGPGAQFQGPLKTVLR